MPAHEKLNDVQFEYLDPASQGATRTHRINAMRGEEKVGHMSWDRKQVLNIESSIPRQGLATALWNEGHRLAGENQRIPAPKHSAQRTTAGDAWGA